jgi:hypothetical protein
MTTSSIPTEPGAVPEPPRALLTASLLLACRAGAGGHRPRRGACPVVDGIEHFRGAARRCAAPRILRHRPGPKIEDQHLVVPRLLAVPLLHEEIAIVDEDRELG